MTKLLRVLARALGGVLLFTLALGLAAVLSLHLPLVHRMVASQVARVLATTFEGRITIDRIGRLGLTCVEGVDAHVDDPRGKPVLQVEGLRGCVSTWTLLRSLLGSSEIVVDVLSVDVARAGATLEADENGKPWIARAFELRPDTSPGQAPRAVRVTLRRVWVEDGNLHIPPTAVGALDADIHRAEASMTLATGRLAIDLPRASLVVHGLPNGAQALGDVVAHLTDPSFHVHALWNGSVNTIRERADFTYDAGHIDAVVDVASATPEAVRSVWPSYPISAITAAHVEAHGVPPGLDVSAYATIGRGTVNVAGLVMVGPAVQATVHVGTKDIDAQEVLPSAPHTRLTVLGDVSLSIKGTGAIDGRGTLVLAGGSAIETTRLPGATIAGKFARSASGEPSARVVIAVREPGAPTVINAELATKAGVPMVTFDAKATVARIDAIARTHGVATGSADLRAAGTINLKAETLDARLSGTLAHLAARGASLDTARVEARAVGPITSPSIDVDVEGSGLEFRSLRLSAMHARGRLSLDGGPTLHDVELDATGEGEPAHVRAEMVRVSDSTLHIDDAVVDGLGAQLAATVKIAPSVLIVQAKTNGIDLARVNSFATIPIARGVLSLDVDGIVGAGSAEGHIAIGLEHAAFRQMADINARIDVTLHGRHASGHAMAQIDDIGTVALHSSSIDVTSGRLLTASSWKQAWGAIDFEAHLDLAKVALRLPPHALPFDEIVGKLDVIGRLARDGVEDTTPDVEVTLRTTGLVIVKTGKLRQWRIEGLDPKIHVTVDGENGNTAVQAEVRDAVGMLVTLDAQSSAVPYAIVFSDDSPVNAFRAMPFDAHVVIPSRRIELLPPAFHIGDVAGELQASGSWHGAVIEPTVDVAATLMHARTNPAIVSRPFDLTLGAHYASGRVDAKLDGATHRRQVFAASARVNVRATDVLAGLAGAELPWTASGQAKLDELPLDSIGLFDDRQVRGNVSGQLSVDDLHSDARASAALAFDGLQVGGVSCRSSVVKLTVDGQALDASARLDQENGFIEARAHVGTRWGTANAPALDTSKAAEASVLAKQFRAAFLLPFLPRRVTELDGRIDADARVTIAAGGSPVQAQGTIAVEKGIFEQTSFGGEFHDISGTLTLTPDGVVRLQSAKARGVRGSVQAAATGRLDGLSLASVRARIVLPPREPLPLVFDGVQMGLLDGAFDLSMDRSGANHAVDIVIDLPTAHLQLPPGSSSLDVQPLDDVDGVTVGVRRSTGEFVETPLDGSPEDVVDPAAARRSPIQIVLRLGDVRVNRGKDLDVHLEGQPTITITDETRVTGQIRMLHGTIDVRGKPFTIEHGAVTFLGDDATNPQVVLSASWTAPDGTTRVYADFVGPLKTGKVRLRSDPAKTQSQILAVLLFGTSDDQRSSPSGTSAQVTSVAAEAGGAATQPLNHALDNLGLGGGISTKIDTSQTNPRPEVEVQIARDISLQIAWVLGVPPPSMPDTTLVTLDWHFLRKWSLETTVGDAGTSILDLVWQHRY